MPKFVVYEVWTRALVIEADSASMALQNHDAEPVHGMNLCNWHAVPCDAEATGQYEDFHEQD